MKINPFTAAAFAALIMVTLSCENEPSDKPPKDIVESPHSGNILVVVDEQVWEHNNKILFALSDLYYESSRHGRINIWNHKDEFLGKGIIEEGKLSFTLVEPDNLYSIEDNDIFGSSFHDWWDEVTIVEPGIKGNVVSGMYFHGDEDDEPEQTRLIMKEKLVGTSDSLAMDFIVFVYVNGDCRITGKEKDTIDPGIGYYHSEPLDLTLKEGWNMVCREICYYSDRLIVDMPMEIKDLVNFKWALWEEQHPIIIGD